MSSPLSAAIRVHVLNGDTAAADHKAVLAVLDKCEQMRGDGGVGRFFADEFEQTIARALGITEES
jgi:hypothetical protein